MTTPNPNTVFITGPFEGLAQWVRQMVIYAFERAGHEVRMKHGGVAEPVSTLIESADAMVAVVGAVDPSIADVWGQSLVDKELEYGYFCKKPVWPVLLAESWNCRSEGSLKRLRKRLKGVGKPVVLKLQDRDSGDDSPRYQDEPSHLFGCLLAHAKANGVGDSAHLQRLRVAASEVTEPAHVDIWNKALNPKQASARLGELVGTHQDLGSIFEADLKTLCDAVRSWGEAGRAGMLRPRKVFISYARRDFADDTAWIDGLGETLEEDGFEPWRDTRRLSGGDRFEAIIEHEIDRSGAFIVLASEHAARSDWVAKEVERARKRRVDDPDFKIIPIRLDEVTPEDFAGGALADLSFVDARKAVATDIYGEIINALRPGPRHPTSPA